MLAGCPQLLAAPFGGHGADVSGLPYRIIMLPPSVHYGFDFQPNPGKQHQVGGIFEILVADESPYSTQIEPLAFF